MAERTADGGRVQWGGSVGKTDHNGTPCRDDAVFAALIQGELDDDELAVLYRHADDCARCRELMVQLARVQRVALEADAPTEVPARPAEASPRASIEPGTKMDQYRLTRQIGEGGMGRVFAADDETLGRSVAIKVVRPAGGRSDPAWTVRLVREAQAMAKLTHPNVLTVYGVGTIDTDVYIAMELVDGVTLGRWTSEDRPWAAVLRTYMAAGRGLAAAHAAGLVHRDFKPSNVLVSVDGRVLVTDFGLAMQAGEEDGPVGPSSTQSWGDGLTQTGMMLGTPAYMAPEQVAGTLADARADQFAFCVALTEALYGEHPFGRDVAKATDATTWSPRFGEQPGLPIRLRGVLGRGMQRDPDDRFASMDALLGELRAIAKWRRRLLGAAVVGVAVTSAAWLGATLVEADPPDPCPEGVPGVIDDAWDSTKRAAVAARFAETPLPDALDRYARRWTDLAQEACVATRVRGETSEAVLDARMTCLDGRRRSLRAAAELLASGQVSEAPVALDLAYALPDLAPCENLRLLRYLDSPDPDPDERAKLDAATDALWQAHALAMIGRRDEGQALLSDAMIEVDALGHKPLQAEARQVRAAIVADADAGLAEQLRREGYQLAMISHADHTAAGLALSLAQGAAFTRGDAEMSAVWLELADSHAQRSELDIDAALAFTRGAVAASRGQFEEAAEDFAQSAAAGERSGAKPSDVAAAYGNLAACHLELGRPERAEAPLRKAIAMMRDAFGPDDVRTLDNEANAAAAHRLRGDLDAAHRELTDVLARQRRALGDRHPSVASTLMALAKVEREMHRPSEAQSLDTEALQIQTEVFGEDSTMAAAVHRALGEDARAQNDVEAARRHFEQALATFERRLGPEHAKTLATREVLSAL